MTTDKVKGMFKMVMAKVKKGWQIFLGMVLLLNDWYENTREANEKVLFGVMLLAVMFGISFLPVDFVFTVVAVFGLLRGYGLVAKGK